MTGTFTLSLDTELIWGVLHWEKERYTDQLEGERKAIDRLLVLLSRYEISATWAIVGHLFLDSCNTVKGKKHPDMPRPVYPWLKKDWYADDPASDWKRSPLFYAPDVVQKILRATPEQEIGCHGFSHALLGEEGMTNEVADAEIKKCVELAKKGGIALRSMVFPQNSVGHVDVLKKYGFTSYRGPDPLYYQNWPKPLRKLAHPIDLTLGSVPPVVEAVCTPEGVLDIPGSMLYLSCDGIRKFIPVAARVQRAKRGIDAAVAQGKIFHLWFHPFNLVSNQKQMMQGLEEIFAYADQKRKEGKLEILNMEEIAARAEKKRAGTRIEG